MSNLTATFHTGSFLSGCTTSANIPPGMSNIYNGNISSVLNSSGCPSYSQQNMLGQHLSLGGQFNSGIAGAQQGFPAASWGQQQVEISREAVFAKDVKRMMEDIARDGIQLDLFDRKGDV